MTNLRNLAKGEMCRVRLPGICNHNPETTVLAHIRLGFYGAGMKPPDICGVWACHACHDEIDRRTMRMTDLEVESATLRALSEQLQHYVAKGIIKW